MTEPIPEAVANSLLNECIEQIEHDSFWAGSLTDEQWSSLTGKLRPQLAQALADQRAAGRREAWAWSERVWEALGFVLLYLGSTGYQPRDLDEILLLHHEGERRFGRLKPDHNDQQCGACLTLRARAEAGEGA